MSGMSTCISTIMSSREVLLELPIHMFSSAPPETLELPDLSHASCTVPRLMLSVSLYMSKVALPLALLVTS